MYRITIKYTDRTETSDVWPNFLEGIDKLRDPNRTVASVIVIKLLVPNPDQLTLPLS